MADLKHADSPFQDSPFHTTPRNAGIVPKACNQHKWNWILTASLATLLTLGRIARVPHPIPRITVYFCKVLKTCAQFFLKQQKVAAIMYMPENAPTREIIARLIRHPIRRSFSSSCGHIQPVAEHMVYFSYLADYRM